MTDFDAEMAAIKEQCLNTNKKSAKEAADWEALLEIARENMWWWEGYHAMRKPRSFHGRRADSTSRPKYRKPKRIS